MPVSEVYKYWTVKDLKFLKQNVRLTDKQLAKILGRTLSSIKNTRQKYGFKKPQNRGCFQKGAAPWNKGKEYKAGGRSAETRFKKGHQPHNDTRAMYEVFERVDDGKLQKFIKLPGSRQYPYGRYVYEQIFGKLSSNYVVRFRDGNALNCEPCNLFKVTRAENCRMNSNRKKGGESMRKVWAVVKTFEDFGLECRQYKFRSKRKVG
jgi:hypothetical protein